MSFAFRLCSCVLAVCLSLNCVQPVSSASVVQNSFEELAALLVAAGL
jgi:hypothetical protein